MNRNLVASHWKLRWHDAIIDAVELMDWDIVEGNWEMIRAKVRERWGKLSDNQLDRISGKRDQLVDAIRKSYGIGKEEAEWQVRDWEARNDEWFDQIARRVQNNVDTLRH